MDELRKEIEYLKDQNKHLHSLLESVVDAYNTITVGDIYFCKCCYKEVKIEDQTFLVEMANCENCNEIVCRECFDEVRKFSTEHHPVCPLCFEDESEEESDDSALAECDKCGATVLRRDMPADMSCPVCAKK